MDWWIGGWTDGWMLGLGCLSSFPYLFSLFELICLFLQQSMFPACKKCCFFDSLVLYIQF